MKLLNLLIVLLFSMSIYAQYDVQLTSSFSPTSTPVGSSSTFTMQLNNIGIEIPANTLSIQVQFPTTFYSTSSSSSAPTGAGAAYFSWTELVPGLWYGTSNTPLQAIFGGGPIIFQVIGASTTSPSAFTQANIGLPSGVTDINVGNNTPAAGLIITPTVLPVTVTNFSSSLVDCKNAKLSWSTSSESNHSSFSIERSFDGEIYETLGAIESKHNSNTKNDYSFIDKNLPVNGDYYYRLKSEDLDGALSIEGLSSLRRNCKVDFEASIYPNPTTDKILFTFNGEANESKQIYILDNTGKIIRSHQVTAGVRNEISVKELSAGIYNIRCTNDGVDYTKRFIKID
jgi:hypothetical protein